MSKFPSPTDYTNKLAALQYVHFQPVWKQTTFDILQINHKYGSILFSQKCTVVVLTNATKQFWYALQNPKWRRK